MSASCTTGNTDTPPMRGITAADSAAVPESVTDGPPAIAVLVSGRGSNLEAILRAIEAGWLRARVALVLSSRPGVPALDIARAHGAPTGVIVPRAYASRAEAGAAIVRALRAARARLVVLAGYSPILDVSVLAAYPQRILNVHPSLLPAFAGGMAPRPQAEALAAGVKISGCTVHFATNDVDAGPIIAQATVPVLEGDTVESLAARILEQEHRLLPEAIALVLAGRVRVQGRRTHITAR